MNPFGGKRKEEGGREEYDAIKIFFRPREKKKKKGGRWGERGGGERENLAGKWRSHQEGEREKKKEKRKRIIAGDVILLLLRCKFSRPLSDDFPRGKSS